MGGGSNIGGRYNTNYERAKNVNSTLEASSASKPNVFISFDHDDKNNVELFRGQAKNENNDLNFSDHSVKEAIDSERANYIKEKIKEKIKRCSVTVVYLSDKTHKSAWVNWEIKESIDQGKGVIGVYQGDKEPSKKPTEFVKNECKIVKWKHGELTKAIETASKNR